MVFGSIFRSRFGQAISLTGYVIKWGLITHVALEYVGCIVICEGESMEPTLSTGDIIVADHITPRFGQVNRGDIIIARSPNKPTEHICKRVMAVAGDALACNRVDGTIAAMPVVPRGHVWVEGDNAAKSQDSRDYGPIPLGLIKGKVLFRLWPPQVNIHRAFAERLKVITRDDTK